MNNSNLGQAATNMEEDNHYFKTLFNPFKSHYYAISMPITDVWLSFAGYLFILENQVWQFHI